MASSVTADTPLTARQREVLRLIVRHFEDHGAPPSYRELMAALGIRSPNGLWGHISLLTRRGLLTGHSRGGGRGKTATRSLRVPGLAVRVEYAPGEAGRRLREALEGEA